MLDFAQSYPATSIYGIDIQPRLFPRNLPPNVSISVCSVTKLPLDWAETFDFIHQRLLCLALTTLEWKAARSEMFRVLKPGGWIQLEEVLVDFPNSGPVTKRLGAAIHQVAQRRGVMSRCAESLPSLLSEAGFVKVASTKRDIVFGGRDGEPSQGATSTVREFLRCLKEPVTKAGLVSSSEEYDKLLQDAENEWRNVSGSSKKAQFPVLPILRSTPVSVPFGDLDFCELLAVNYQYVYLPIMQLRCHLRGSAAIHPLWLEGSHVGSAQSRLQITPRAHRSHSSWIDSN